MSTTVTSRGRVTIPKKVREWLGIQPGSAVDFEVTPGGDVILRHAKRPMPRTPMRFATVRGVATVKMTTDEILGLTRGDSPRR